MTPLRSPGPGGELARVHVLVDPRDLAVLAQPDDADPERPAVTAVLHAGERVLDHEAALEGVDRAVVVGAPSLSGVALRQRGEVLGARRVAPEHVVPDDAVRRVDLGQLVDAAVLVGVEEAVAQLADLAVGHDSPAAGLRNLLESRYSSMCVMLPVACTAPRRTPRTSRASRCAAPRSRSSARESRSRRCRSSGRRRCGGGARRSPRAESSRFSSRELSAPVRLTQKVKSGA